jgi:hypothetical protein
MNSRDRRSGAPPALSPGLKAGFVVSLALGCLLFWLMAFSDSSDGPEHPLAFPAIDIDQKRLDGERTEKYAEARSNLEKSPPEEFLEVVRKVNRQQFTNDVAKRRETAERLSYLANEVIPKTGYEGFMAAGQPVFDKCRKGLEELLEAVRSGELELSEARSDPAPGQFGRYRTNCGRLLPTLIERGLVDQQGYWTKPVELSQTIFDILQRLRWANIIHSRRPPMMQLTEYERELLMRWRIEDPDAYGRDKKEEFLKRTERNPEPYPSYDVPLTRAKIAYQTGDLQTAAEILKKQLREDSGDTSDYREALEWLEGQLETESPGN